MDFIEAVKKGDVPLIIELIDKGVDINVPDKDGYTALMYVVRYNYVWVDKMLIKAGANVNAQDDGGRTALMWTTLYDYPLQIAELLVEAGADVNIKNKKGETVFDFAITEDKPELTNLFKKCK